MSYKQKGFPKHQTASPLTDNHTRWARFKNKAGEFADKAEGWVEGATYVPGIIGTVASGLDGLKDSYDAYSAKKSGDIDRYNREMVDVGLNAFNVATGGTSKLMSTAAKKGLKEGSKYLAGEGAKKFGQAIAKKSTTDAMKEGLNNERDPREYKGEYDYKKTMKNKYR
jgi:hypothetical protein